VSSDFCGEPPLPFWNEGVTLNARWARERLGLGDRALAGWLEKGMRPKTGLIFNMSATGE
jgi:hypothetical protein